MGEHEQNRTNKQDTSRRKRTEQDKHVEQQRKKAGMGNSAKEKLEQKRTSGRDRRD